MLDIAALRETKPTRAATASSPVRVLFIIDELCRVGGAETALVHTVNNLPKDRFRCSIVTFRSDPGSQIFDSLSCPVHVLPLRRTYDLNAFKTALHLRRIIRDGRVDIVHTFFETADLWGGLVAKLSGCPILISSRRDLGIQRCRKHWPLYRMLRGIFDEVQTVSEEVRRFSISADRLDPRRVRTLHNGVRLAPWPGAPSPASRRPPDLAGASHVIVAVGNVRHVKGYDVLIRAASVVCSKHPRALIVIAGSILEDDCYADLMRLSTRLGIEQNVRFVGPVADVPGLLAHCDVFCNLSRSEGLSNALLEGMAARLPCVATRVGGNPEAVRDGHNGYLVDNEDHEAAAAAILELLEQPGVAAKMGSNSLETVQSQFTVEAMIEKLVASYDSLLSRDRHEYE